MTNFEDSINLLKQMTNSVRVEFQYQTEYWTQGMAEIDTWCNVHLQENFRVMMTREDDLTDTHAWYVVFCSLNDVDRLIKQWPSATAVMPTPTVLR